ncbi:hypothetical protein StoSoilB13_38980 (plasmid) [Arthrobacter sp. StoSoilB13]|nr:hypothetical protein StoSoilB13_38980 [Arthrobacter sp. StoSoilB13]
MHQDDRDVDVQTPKRQPDDGNHQGAHRDTASRRPEVKALARLLLSGGECQPDSGEDCEKRSGPARENQSDPRGFPLGRGAERRHQMGGHHSEQGQAAGGIYARKAGGDFASPGHLPGWRRLLRSHAAIVSQGTVALL